MCVFFFFQAEDGIRDDLVTGVQTCALPIYREDSLIGRVFAGRTRAPAGGSRQRRDSPLEQPELLTQFEVFLHHLLRSEERRVGKECRARGAPYHEKKKD